MDYYVPCTNFITAIVVVKWTTKFLKYSKVFHYLIIFNLSLTRRVACGDPWRHIKTFHSRKGKKLSLCLTKHYAMKTWGEWIYWLTFSSSRHWVKASGQLHATADLPPVPTGLENLWALESKFLTLRDSNSDRSVAKSVASRYIDWATTALFSHIVLLTCRWKWLKMQVGFRQGLRKKKYLYIYIHIENMYIRLCYMELSTCS
jgi:hypothetical protein